MLFGGLLTKYAGWEWIFFVNVPVGVLLFVAAPFRVAESERHSRAVSVTCPVGSW